MNVSMAPLSKTAVVQDYSIAEVMRFESNDSGNSAVFLDTCQVRTIAVGVVGGLIIDGFCSRA